jgi:aminoglycoside phosphotransferase family enzyme/predicted kinase
MLRMHGEPTVSTALEGHAALIAALRDPAAYPHDTGVVEVIETHISSVLLAGDRAYKLKKPVAIGFLDFSTLERRRFFCEEEVRLNRRTAPDLYLAVVPITAERGRPQVAGRGNVLEYAVCMRRFATGDLLSERADAGRIGPADVDRLAAVIASLHERAARAPTDSPWGSADIVCRSAEANFAAMRELLPAACEGDRLDALAALTEDEGRRQSPRFEERRTSGFVRECRGDLHLGNIVLFRGEPLLFDCIEFNPELRWIDVQSDLAFAVMDLLDRGLSPLAWRLLDAYLERTGDFTGIAVHRWYAAYRALVRAKVSLIRERQTAASPEARSREHAGFERHLRLAETVARPSRRLLIAMTGLSGSGKSTVARSLSEHVGAVRFRSDVERKRLCGFAPDADSRGAPDEGIYTPHWTARTYERLREVARDVLLADHPVIVDAACLLRSERDGLREVARGAGAPFVLVACEAPLDVLRARIDARSAAREDPSDATAAVLEMQRRRAEPPEADELADLVVIDTDVDTATLDARCAEIAANCRSRAVGLQR